MYTAHTGHTRRAESAKGDFIRHLNNKLHIREDIGDYINWCNIYIYIVKGMQAVVHVYIYTLLNLNIMAQDRQ